MAEKGLFFNALPDSNSVTGYDRNYNADDISDWLKMVFETGVVKGGLEVTEAPEASDYLAVNVTAGRASILGKPYINDSIKLFSLDVAPTGSSPRYDYIVLRLDNTQTKSGRRIYLDYVKGTNSRPQVADLTRNDTIHELLIAYIVVQPSATKISQSQIFDCRGSKDDLEKEYCPWFTAVKGYQDYYDAIVLPFEDVVVVDSLSNVVITNLPSNLYNGKYSFIEIYKNGLLINSSSYTFSTDSDYISINFVEGVSAGSEIVVKLKNFIDGEGLSNAMNDYTRFVTDVSNLKIAGEYNYVCNGTNDNVRISEIVKTYLAGGTDYGSLKLNIIGNLGMNAPVRGGGNASNPFGWFDFDTTSNRRVTIDFTRSGQISPTISNGTYNVIFYTNSHINIIGSNVIANNTSSGTTIRVINASTGVIKFEDCRFYINGYQDSLIAMRGTFINCRGSVANIVNNSYCFLPSSYGIVKIQGGEYYAYTGDSTKQSSIVGQSGVNSVSILYGVSAPTVARSGFYQTNSLLQWTGGGILSCTDLISALPMVVVSGISNIRGTIAYSKTDVL